MPKIFTTLDKIRPVFDITEKVIMVICKILLIADILITSYAVGGRLFGSLANNYPIFKFLTYIFDDPAWSEEIVLTLMSYMAVLAAAIAVRQGAHIRMTALDPYLPKKVLKGLDILSDVCLLIFALIMLIVGWKYTTTLGSRGSYISIPSLSKFWMYLPVPLAGLVMIVFQLEALYDHIRGFFVKEEADV